MSLPSDEALVDYRELEKQGLRNNLGERLVKPVIKAKPITPEDEEATKLANFEKLFGPRVSVEGNLPEEISLIVFEDSMLGRDMLHRGFVVRGPLLGQPHWYEEGEIFEALAEFDRNARRSAHIKVEAERRQAENRRRIML